MEGWGQVSSPRAVPCAILLVLSRVKECRCRAGAGLKVTKMEIQLSTHGLLEINALWCPMHLISLFLCQLVCSSLEVHSPRFLPL